MTHELEDKITREDVEEKSLAQVQNIGAEG
jgi:hypothetical protein